MKNVFVTGSGRSGTSMLAGMFAKAGYFLGDRLHPPRESNPKGFFEDEHINALNEEIITYSVRTTFGGLAAARFLARYKTGHLWLGRFPIEHDFVCNDEQRGAIRRLTDRQPFCFKDPRFCFTLENWIAGAPNSLVLCIFREPASTVESILKECRSAAYLFDFSISVQDAFAIWRELYWRMLRLYQRRGNIRFVYYGDVLRGNVIERLEKVVGTEFDRTFPETSLDRTSSALNVDELSSIVFDGLMNLCRGDFGENRTSSRVNLVRDIDEKLSRAESEIAAERARGGRERQLIAIPAWQSAAMGLTAAQREPVRMGQDVQEPDHERVERLTETVQELGALLSQYGERLQSVHRTIAHQEREIAELKMELGRRETDIAGLQADIGQRETEIAAIHASMSWRITWPLRAVKRLWLATTLTRGESWPRKFRKHY